MRNLQRCKRRAQLENLESRAMLAATCWTFDNPSARFAAEFGPATMDYYDPNQTGWGPDLTQFGTPGSFGLPDLPGGEAQIMRFPATTFEQGYTVTHNALPNGSAINGPNIVGNYTIIMDLLFPTTSDATWRSLYQTNVNNGNDGELFVHNSPSGGIGISGNYHGAITPDEWHRVAVAVRAADGEGQMIKYIDGQFVGAQGTTGSAIGFRWSLDPVIHLFADENGDTAEGFVSSAYFVDRLLSIEEVRALGGPAAAGAHVAATAAAPLRRDAERRVAVIAHRGNSCCAPENTLAAIQSAAENGADMIEIDIRLTADGHAVLLHDSTLDRTTDGSGAVADLTLAELQALQLDAGSWFDPAFSNNTVPTLTEALELADQQGLRVELDPKVSGMGPAIQAAIQNANSSAESIWPWVGTSANRAREYRQHISGVELLWGGVPASLDQASFEELRTLGVTGFDIHYSSLTSDFADAAHQNGMFVSVFTILDLEQMRRVISLGADAMETDFPKILNEIMPQPLRVLSVDINAGLMDPLQLPAGPQPTSWSEQRSELRSIVVNFNMQLAEVGPQDLSLTNVGLNAQTPDDQVIQLTNNQLSTDGKMLAISFADEALSDGVYRLDVLDTVTDLVGNQLQEIFTLVGNESNGLFQLTGDWNGDRGVSIFDFATFAYWFGQRVPVAPEYVDLNDDGGVSIFDFADFAANFGIGIVFPVGLAERPHDTFPKILTHRKDFPIRDEIWGQMQDDALVALLADWSLVRPFLASAPSNVFHTRWFDGATTHKVIRDAFCVTPRIRKDAFSRQSAAVSSNAFE